MRIGVVALQGAFKEHIEKLQMLQVEAIPLSQQKDIDDTLDGIILPGGESSVISKLLVDFDMLTPLTVLIRTGIPVFGTCAGLILLSRSLTNGTQTSFPFMDITTIRNAYGRQLGSFMTTGKFHQHEIPMVFIRAPYIESYGKQVEPLASIHGHIVAARQRNMLVCAFHPELTEDNTVYEYFIDMVKGNMKKRTDT